MICNLQAILIGGNELMRRVVEEGRIHIEFGRKIRTEETFLGYLSLNRI